MAPARLGYPSENPVFDEVPEVVLNRFSLDTEFRALAEQCADRVREILLGALSTFSARPGPVQEQQLGVLKPPIGCGALDREMFWAITYPSIWGAFRRLRPGEQVLALQGDASGTRRLVDEYARWFAKRAYDRKKGEGVTERLVLRLLPQLAKACQPGVSHSESAWAECGRKHWPDQRAVDAVFEEAKSAGVVQCDISTDTWQWVYGFVPRSLANSRVRDSGGAP